MSLDAYRGFIMLTMASGAFAFAQVARHLDLSGDDFPAQMWRFLAYQFDHVPWVGCAFWDLIQPSFMFMVGVALPYSVASRKAKGQSEALMFAHAVWRALLLVLLGVFLSSPLPLLPGMKAPPGPLTNWIFPNVLCQIGLGYVFVFLLVGRGLPVQFAALAAILAGYTLLFGLYPPPLAGFDFSSVKGPGDSVALTGWFAHWEKNTNAAHHFDLWFLNLFPRPYPFAFNDGGYQTLNFIPSMATMILGLMAGELLRRPGGRLGKFGILAAAAVVCLAIGYLMGMFVCPIVKRIWTPSWAVYSAGWTFAILAGFYLVIDILGYRRWAFPLVVVGMNSIAMYLMAQLLKPWIRRTLETHLGRLWFDGPYGPVVMSTSILLVLWVFCLWLYRRKVFLRI
jgi:predicted acyltransferase